MKFHDNILCLTYDEVVPGFLSESNYKKLKSRGKLQVIGRGGNGREVLIPYDELPHKYQLLVQAMYGNPYEYMAREPILSRFEQVYRDNEPARAFYESIELSDGRNLSPEHVNRYVKAASLLDMLTGIMNDKKWIKRELNITLEAFWELFYSEYNWKVGGDGKRVKVGVKRKGLIDALGIDLPASDQLKKKWKRYREGGYRSLVSGRFNNEHTRKVDENLERLILSLYAQADPKPYASEVCLQYLQFLDGTLNIVDLVTGELYDPGNFYRDDQPIVISEATVKNYINKPANRLLVDSVRVSGLEYSGKHRPHVHRRAPVFAFSKISMDDIAIPFKLPDGTRVWSYQIFDVASQAIVGVAFARDKTQTLVRAAITDMARLIVENGWGMPAEIEVEQHLNSGMKGGTDAAGEFTPDLLTEGVVFPFVRFCRGGNPREKRAEGFIKKKKYGFQSKRKGFQYRPFARLEANRLNGERDKVTYTFDAIIANEREDIVAYNNAPHPDQETYPGLSRWQVLEQFQNPNLSPVKLHIVLPFVGEGTGTTIMRNQYVTVGGYKFALPSVSVLDRLDSTAVQAYYLPTGEGRTGEVYLYQNGEFICSCQRLDGYQEARIEQTDGDIHEMHRQLGYLSSFDAAVRQRRAQLGKIATVKAGKPGGEVREDAPDAPTFPTEQGGYMQGNGDGNYWWMDEDEVNRRAINNL